MILDAQQRAGSEWLAGRRRAYLADAPGLGKTVMACDALQQINAETVLVVCPAIAQEVWREHLHRIVPRTNAVIMSYEKMLRQVDDINVGDASAFILDEVHRAKELGAKRTVAALTLAQKARRVWMLSGTPMPKNAMLDLYTVLRAVWPDKLRRLGITSHLGYINYFAEVEPQYVMVRGHRKAVGIKVVQNRHEVEARALLADIMLRRVEGPDLPPLRWENFPLPALENLATIERLTTQVLGQDDAISWEEIAANAKSLATARRLLGATKAAVVADYLKDELENNAYDKIVVVAYHLDVLNTLEQALYTYGLRRIDGSKSPRSRADHIDLFQHDQNTRVLLGQITAMGEAITLTAASEIAFVEQSWTPDENFQVAKRIHRIGQTRPCRARSFVAPCRIDRALARVHAGKLGRRNALIEEAQ